MKEKCEAAFLQPGDHTYFGVVDRVVSTDDEQQVTIYFRDGDDQMTCPDDVEITFWEEKK